MAYSAFAVANAFVQRAEQGRLANLSPMKLQKLLYFTQAWHLKALNTPILDDNFTRWQHGPVIPAVYHEFKAYGYRPITRMATTLAVNGSDYSMYVPSIPLEDVNTWSLVDAVINRYGVIDAQILSNMTHLPGSAWSLNPPDGGVITTAEILADKTI